MLDTLQIAFYENGLDISETELATIFLSKIFTSLLKIHSSWELSHVHSHKFCRSSQPRGYPPVLSCL